MKRYTVMLNEETINKIKLINLKPTAKREFIEWNINKICGGRCEELINLWINETAYDK